MVKTIEFGPSMEQLLSPGTLVPICLDSKYGATVGVELNEFGDPQKIDIKREKEFPIPEGSVIEPQWRDIIAYNRNLAIGKSIFTETMPHILNFLGNAATLFLFHDHKGYNTWLNNIAKTIVEEFTYTMFDTKVKNLAMGIPKGKGAENISFSRGRGGSAYSGFGKYGKHTGYNPRDGDYAVIGFSDSEPRVYSGGVIDRLVKKASNSR